MSLPSLPEFSDATIEQVTLGPRRELTLIVQLLSQVNGATRSPAIAVRFGGIINYAAVEAFFTVPHYEHSEIGRVGYVPHRQFKPGQLYIEFLYERIDAGIVIECGSLTVK